MPLLTLTPLASSVQTGVPSHTSPIPRYHHNGPISPLTSILMDLTLAPVLIVELVPPTSLELLSFFQPLPGALEAPAPHQSSEIILPGTGLNLANTCSVLSG